jgi:hypothetical protein
VTTAECNCTQPYQFGSVVQRTGRKEEEKERKNLRTLKGKIKKERNKSKRK